MDAGTIDGFLARRCELVTWGEIAALTTSLLWALTSLLFTQATARVGSGIVNRSRLLLASILLTAFHFILYRSILPVDAGWTRWFWLSTSGIIGLVIGDAFLFQAFVLIGPRLSMLLMSLAPVIATIFSWVFLDERLSLLQLLAILITVGGIASVVGERKIVSTVDEQPENKLPGILLGIGAATGQALGLITSKLGLAGDFPALSGNLMRVLVATAILWMWTLLRGQVPMTMRALRDHRIALRYIAAGSVVGPFLGIWFSLMAVQYTEVGIASTLMGLAPIILLPLSRILLKEHISGQAIVGTLVAMVGVAMLFLV